MVLEPSFGSKDFEISVCTVDVTSPVSYYFKIKDKNGSNVH